MLYLLLHKRKCESCGKLSHRDVLFCWSCGSSFNLRICASGHKNPFWVQRCLICGKDRSLMSRPHTSATLSFSRHPTKAFSYVPGRRKIGYVFALSMICLGTALLAYVGIVIVRALLSPRSSQ